MIRRIELINFMSHGHTVIEPADGLTVLVGPNNCGKSAVVAALQILCHNENSTYVTRHHERECTVRLETDDGHVIEWCRKNNSPRYTIDGQQFDRLGRSGVPDGLHDVLRLPKVIAEGNQEFDVHFGEQKSPVFLLDKPGSHAAQFFASSSDAASLVEMQKRHQQKMADARRERTRLQAQDDKLRSDLAVLAVTDGIAHQVEQVEAQHDELAKIAAVVSQLSHDAQLLEQSAGLLYRRQSEAAALAGLLQPPVLADPKPLTDTISAIDQTRREMERGAACAAGHSAMTPCPDLADNRSLAQLLRELRTAELVSARVDLQCLATHKLSPPPMLDDAGSLRRTAEEIASFQGSVEVSADRFTALRHLTPVPVLDDERALGDDVQALMQAAAALRRAEDAHRRLDVLVPIPALTNTGDIEETIRQLRMAADALAARSDELEQAEQARREAEGMLRTWAEQQQRCPTCGNTLDPEQVVAHTGSCAGRTPHARS